MHFINKNVPEKRDKTFIWGKKRPGKERSWFDERGIPVRCVDLFK